MYISKKEKWNAKLTKWNPHKMMEPKKEKNWSDGHNPSKESNQSVGQVLNKKKKL